MRLLTPEAKLVRLGARLHLGTAGDGEAVASLDRSSIHSGLLEEASREGMAGILAAELRRLARERDLDFRLPLGAFSDALRSQFLHSGAHLTELWRLGDSLRARGLRAIVLKGAALIPTVYHGAPGLRPLSDVDLLVQTRDRAAVKAELLRHGFVSPSESSNLLTKGAVAFDLHTDLVGRARIRRRALAFRLDDLPVWERAVPLGTGDDGLFVLSHTHQFLHLAVHALKHSFSRLVWLVDLGLVARRLDWTAALDEAEASGTVRAVAYAAVCLERILGVAIPEPVRARCPSFSRLESFFLDGVAERRGSPALGEIVTAESIPSYGQKLGYLFELAFPERQVLAEASPKTPQSLLHARRLVKILLGAAATCASSKPTGPNDEQRASADS